MVVDFILTHFLIILIYVNAFKFRETCNRVGVVGPMSKSLSGSTTSSLFSYSREYDKNTTGLELLSIAVPVQDDPGAYLPLITGTVLRGGS